MSKQAIVQALLDSKTASQFLRQWLTHRDSLFGDTPQLRTFERYYKSYVQRFPDRVAHFYDAQLSEIMELLGDKAPSVLEVGCGTGTESLWLSLHGANVTGIDIRRDRLDVADERANILQQVSQHAIACRFEQRSILELEDTPRYDIVWMEQAYHHLEPRLDVTRKLSTIIKPGGHVVISEANGLNPLLQISLIKQRGFKTIGQLQDSQGQWHPYGNERVLSAQTLASNFSAVGFREKTRRHFRLFPNHPMFDSWLGLEQKTPAWLLPLFTHYNYVGQNVK